jgi:hypothetical protein
MKTYRSCKKTKFSLTCVYFESLRETVISQFRTAPFFLDYKAAATCARMVMKIIQQHHGQAKFS